MKSQATQHLKSILFLFLIFVLITRSYAQLVGLFGAALRASTTAARASLSTSLRSSASYRAALTSLSTYARSSAAPPKLVSVVTPPRYVGYPPRAAYIESASSVTDDEFRVILNNLLNGGAVSSKVVPGARVSPLSPQVESTLLQFGILVKNPKTLVDPLILVGAQGKSAQWVDGDLIQIANSIKIKATNEQGFDVDVPPPPCDPATVPVGSYCSLYYMQGNPENKGQKSEICGGSSCFMIELDCSQKTYLTEFISSGCYNSAPANSSVSDWICSDNCQWACLEYFVYSPITKSCCINVCNSDEYVDGCDQGIAILNTSSNSATILPQNNPGVCKQCLFLPGRTKSFTAHPISNPCGFMCITGYYNPVINLDQGNQDCLECPPGKYGQLTNGYVIITPSQAQGRDWAGICTLCPSGKYSSFFASTTCVSCNTGKYSSGQGLSDCLECDPGKYTSVSGAIECTFCSVGTYQPQYAGTSCQLCELNPAIDPGSVSCPSPSAGSFRSLLPMIICPAGQYMDITLNMCVYCSSGTYSTGIGLDNLAWDVLPTYVNTYAYAFGRSAAQCKPTVFESSGGYCTFYWDAGASSTIIVSGYKTVIGVVTTPAGSGTVYVTEFTLQRNIYPSTSETFVTAGNVGGKPHAVTLLTPAPSISVTLKASPKAGQWVKATPDMYVSFVWTVLYSISPCLPCPPGTISKNNYCIPASEICGNFYYVKDNKCVRCSFQCPSGQYYKADCNSSSDIQCVTCPLACNPGEYIISPCYNSLPPKCSQCNTCITGTFQKTQCDGINKATCQTCQSCQDGKYLVPGSCNGTSDSVCAACSTCVLGQTYEVSACSGGQNRVCATCGSCPSGKYQTQPCTLLTAPVCQICTSCVVQGQSYYSDPRSRFPIVLVLTPEFETAPCGGPQGDRKCTKCTPCASGKYASTPCMGTQDNTCTNCTTTCPVGKKLVVVCLNGIYGSQDSYCSNYSAGC